MATWKSFLLAYLFSSQLLHTLSIYTDVNINKLGKIVWSFRKLNLYYRCSQKQMHWSHTYRTPFPKWFFFTNKGVDYLLASFDSFMTTYFLLKMLSTSVSTLTSIHDQCLKVSGRFRLYRLWLPLRFPETYRSSLVGEPHWWCLLLRKLIHSPTE